MERIFILMILIGGFFSILFALTMLVETKGGEDREKERMKAILSCISFMICLIGLAGKAFIEYTH